MPKVKKITNHLFVGDRKEYLKFLNLDEDFGFEGSEQLDQMKQSYKDLLNENDDMIDKLTLLEEIIIQIRCKEVILEELRLSLNQNKKKDMPYIYARTLFYRRNKQINDIRVCIGSSDQYGTDLVGLLEDEEFRHICCIKLTEAMDKEIESNIINLRLVYTNE